MIELIFVIVVLGILAAVAIPKFAASRDDAYVAKAKSTVAAVRSGIVNERQSRLFRGDNTYINKLDHQVNTPGAGVTIFDNNGSSANSIMMYGVTTANKSGSWMKTNNNEYTIKINGFSNNAVFDYNSSNGTFTCTRLGGDLCGVLSN